MPDRGMPMKNNGRFVFLGCVVVLFLSCTTMYLTAPTDLYKPLSENANVIGTVQVHFESVNPNQSFTVGEIKRLKPRMDEAAHAALLVAARREYDGLIDTGNISIGDISWFFVRQIGAGSSARFIYLASGKVVSP